MLIIENINKVDSMAIETRLLGVFLNLSPLFKSVEYDSDKFNLGSGLSILALNPGFNIYIIYLHNEQFNRASLIVSVSGSKYTEEILNKSAGLVSNFISRILKRDIIVYSLE